MENGRFWESPHGPRALSCAMACGPSSRAPLRAGLRSNLDKGQSRAGLEAWPVAFDGGPYQTLLCSWVQFSGITDGLPTYVVTSELQVERGTGKVRRPKTDVLPTVPRSQPSSQPVAASFKVSNCKLHHWIVETVVIRHVFSVFIETQNML